MLWVERNLRRSSSRVWGEEGLNAHIFIKIFKYAVYSKTVYLRIFLKVSNEGAVHNRMRAIGELPKSIRKVISCIKEDALREEGLHDL